MKAWSLLLLRVSLGLFLVVWGLDKLTNVEHGVLVGQHFYFGLFTGEGLLKAFGAVQVAAGALIALGLLRGVAYPFLLLVTGFTLIAVWKSIVDPLAMVFEDANLVFFSSAVIFPAALVLWAFRDQDAYALDTRRSRPAAAAPALG